MWKDEVETLVSQIMGLLMLARLFLLLPPGEAEAEAETGLRSKLMGTLPHTVSRFFCSLNLVRYRSPQLLQQTDAFVGQSLLRLSDLSAKKEEGSVLRKRGNVRVAQCSLAQRTGSPLGRGVRAAVLAPLPLAAAACSLLRCGNMAMVSICVLVVLRGQQFS